MAEAMLASSEITDGEIERIINGKSSKNGGGGGGGGEGSTGIGKGVINGGLIQGGIVGVWEGRDGDSEVCKTLLVDALLAYPGCGAAVVDSTGNFDVLGLYTRLLERVKEEQVAAGMLERVKIMRVFDFVGVREAVGEIRDGLERRTDHAERSKERMATPKQPTPESLTPEMPKRTVVADSEDEGEEEEEEMLFDVASSDPQRESESTKQLQPRPQLESLQQDAPQGEIKFILLSSLTQVLTPLLKKDSIQANALTSPFLTSLAHLTRTHDLHTILSNPAPLPPTRSAPEQQQQTPPSPSIFASNAMVPSLMGVLGRYVDVALLVSVLPRGKMDARVMYRDGGMGMGVKKMRGVECMSVVEVLGDRWEGRVGAWEVLKAGG